MDAPGQEVSQINEFTVPFILNIDHTPVVLPPTFKVPSISIFRLTAELFFFRSILISYVAWGMLVGDTVLEKLLPLPTSASLSPLLPSPQPLTPFSSMPPSAFAL